MSNYKVLNLIFITFLLFILATILSLKATAQPVCIASITNGSPEICLSSSSITFSNAIASGGVVDWISSGDGTFNNPSAQNPTYTLGTKDITNGYVFIYLDVYTDAEELADACSELVVVRLNLSSLSAVATPSSQSACSGTPMTQVVLSSAVSGVIYNWTRDNTTTVTAPAASGTGNIRGNIASIVNTPVNVTFTITPMANGCPGTPITATVLVNPRPNAVATPSSQTICSGTAITPITFSGNVSGTIYNWTNNNTASVTGIAASGSGTISGTLTNITAAQVANTFTITPTASSCLGTPITATVTVPTTLTAIANSTAVTTPGGSNGTATATPAGGTAPYTYSWNTTPVQTTQTATGLTAGAYTVTVRDFRACATAASTTVSSPACNISASASAGTIACYGGTTTLTVSVSNGTGAIQYSLNGGAFQAANTFTVNAAGSPYTVTVRDASMCTAITNTVTVNQPTVLTATANSTAVTTVGGSNGTATAAPAGGTAPYTYSWNTTPVQTTQTATGLTAGTYTATVRDARMCITTTSTTVSSPVCNISASASAGTIACNGGTTTLTVSASNGNGAIQYNLNGGAFQSANTFTVNTAGSPYTVTVRDASLCTATTNTVTVNQPTILTSTASSTAVTTTGGSDGTATATPSGGTVPYTYSWNTTPVQTTQTATALTAGNYTVTVRDSRGCMTTASTTVTSPTGGCNISAAASAGTISCNGGTTTLTVTASGGTGAFQYSLNGGAFQSANTFTVNAAGSPYTVTVRDASLCTATTNTVTVTQPAAITVTASAGTIACSGGTTSVTVSATGGTPPYTGTGIITLQSAGSRTYTVTDANGCTGTRTITIPAGTGTTPARPSSVTGPNYGLCGGGNFTYSVQAVAGATGYTWTMPASFNITSGQGTSQIQVTVPANFTGQSSIGVSATNGCGSSTVFNFTVFAVLSYPASSITGPSTVSWNQANVQYSLPAVTGATYTWTVPNKAKITSGQGTNSIRVTFGTRDGNIGVTIKNACGTGPKINKPVTVSFFASKTIPAENNTTDLTEQTINEDFSNTATKSALSVYPNPAQNKVLISFSSQKIGSRFKIVINNAVGKPVFIQSGVTSTGKNMLEADLSKFSNGLYLVTLLMTDDGILVQKLYKGE